MLHKVHVETELRLLAITTLIWTRCVTGLFFPLHLLHQILLDGVCVLVGPIHSQAITAALKRHSSKAKEIDCIVSVVVVLIARETCTCILVHNLTWKALTNDMFKSPFRQRLH